VFDISVKASRGKHILDVGCGYGDLLLYYKSRGMICTGVDFSETAVARGREYGLNVLHGSLQSQQFQDACFDKVVLCHSLEHVPDPKQVIVEVRRLLKPGGTLQVAVPNGGSDAFGPNWRHLSFPLHLYHFTESSLLSCLSEAGFRKVTSAVRKRHDVLRVTAEA
jgi:2-polyprenyl-3-methyl-5-hydroxy-6-metoxy-1,4-benzoquinol methylase